MEILLWLVPSAVVTLLAAWGAAVAARREEARRASQQDPSQESPHESGQESVPVQHVPGWDELEIGDGVSEPRPARRPVDPAPRRDQRRTSDTAAADGSDGAEDRSGEDGSQRRSA